MHSKHGYQRLSDVEPIANRAAMINALAVSDVVRAVLSDVLSIDAKRAQAFEADTLLFGSLPELDSMAVAGLLTEIEDRLGIIIDDDDVDGDLLATFGSLTDYAVRKVIK